MKQAVGVIELLISFLLLSIIIAGFMNMTLVQMKDGSWKHMPIMDAQQQAMDEIENIKELQQKSIDAQRKILEQNQ